MTYGHLRADCLYIGISSGPNAWYRVCEAFTFTFKGESTPTVVKAARAGAGFQDIQPAGDVSHKPKQKAVITFCLNVEFTKESSFEVSHNALSKLSPL